MSYTLSQQAFVLSMMVNGDSKRGDDGNESQLEAMLSASIGEKLGNSGLQQLIGKWSVGWGPFVFQEPGSTVADNAMFVAVNADRSVYVVAIAATNFTSTYDLDVEDADVALQPWPYGSTVGLSPHVTQGTIDGVNNLRALPDPAQQQTGQKLEQYLTGAASPGATLVFTGHSLGGALAPALALALTQAGTLKGWGKVDVYPTAGPSTGDADYVSLLRQTFAPASAELGAWNTLTWNSLDVVPHAWTDATMAAITGLYTSRFATSPCVQKMVEQAAARAKASEQAAGVSFTQLPTNGALQGTMAGPKIIANPTAAFLKELVYQHIYAYFGLLGVQQVLALTGAKGAKLFSPPNPYDPAQAAAFEALALSFQAKYCV